MSADKPTLAELRRRLRLAATDILSRFGWTFLQVCGGLVAAEPVQHFVNSQLEAKLPLWAFQVASPAAIALLKNIAAALVGEEGTATFTKAPDIIEVEPVEAPVGPAVIIPAHVDVSPFAVQPQPLAPPPFRDGVEVDSGEADPVDPPEWAT